MPQLGDDLGPGTVNRLGHSAPAGKRTLASQEGNISFLETGIAECSRMIHRDTFGDD
jgi:hypothetical protein